MSLQFTQTSLWYYCKRQLQWNLVSTSCLWWLPYIISRPSKQNLFYLKVSDLVEEKLQIEDEEWYEELSNNTKAYVKTEHVEIEAIKRDWEATSRRITITLVSFEYNQSINQFISFNFSFYNYSSSDCFTLLYSIFMPWFTEVAEKCYPSPIALALILNAYCWVILVMLGGIRLYSRLPR